MTRTAASERPAPKARPSARPKAAKAPAEAKAAAKAAPGRRAPAKAPGAKPLRARVAPLVVALLMVATLLPATSGSQSPAAFAGPTDYAGADVIWDYPSKIDPDDGPQFIQMPFDQLDFNASRYNSYYDTDSRALAWTAATSRDLLGSSTPDHVVLGSDTVTFAGYGVQNAADVVYTTAYDAFETLSLTMFPNQLRFHTLNQTGFLFNGSFTGVNYTGYALLLDVNGPFSNTARGVADLKLVYMVNQPIGQPLPVNTNPGAAGNFPGNGRPNGLAFQTQDIIKSGVTEGQGNSFDVVVARSDTGFALYIDGELVREVEPAQNMGNGFGFFAGYYPHRCPMLTAVDYSNLSISVLAGPATTAREVRFIDVDTGMAIAAPQRVAGNDMAMNNVGETPYVGDEYMIDTSGVQEIESDGSMYQYVGASRSADEMLAMVYQSGGIPANTTTLYYKNQDLLPEKHARVTGSGIWDDGLPDDPVPLTDTDTIDYRIDVKVPEKPPAPVRGGDLTFRSDALLNYHQETTRHPGGTNTANPQILNTTTRRSAANGSPSVGATAGNAFRYSSWSMTQTNQYRNARDTDHYVWVEPQAGILPAGQAFTVDVTYQVDFRLWNQAGTNHAANGISNRQMFAMSGSLQNTSMTTAQQNTLQAFSHQYVNGRGTTGWQGFFGTRGNAVPAAPGNTTTPTNNYPGSGATVAFGVLVPSGQTANLGTTSPPSFPAGAPGLANAQNTYPINGNYVASYARPGTRQTFTGTLPALTGTQNALVGLRAYHGSNHDGTGTNGNEGSIGRTDTFTSIIRVYEMRFTSTTDGAVYTFGPNYTAPAPDPTPYTVTDLLPEGVTYMGTATSGWTATNPDFPTPSPANFGGTLAITMEDGRQRLTWTFPDMPDGNTSINFTVSPNQNGFFENFAEVKNNSSPVDIWYKTNSTYHARDVFHVTEKYRIWDGSYPGGQGGLDLKDETYTWLGTFDGYGVAPNLRSSIVAMTADGPVTYRYYGWAYSHPGLPMDPGPLTPTPGIPPDGWVLPCPTHDNDADCDDDPVYNNLWDPTISDNDHEVILYFVPDVQVTIHFMVVSGDDDPGTEVRTVVDFNVPAGLDYTMLPNYLNPFLRPNGPDPEQAYNYKDRYDLFAPASWPGGSSVYQTAQPGSPPAPAFPAIISGDQHITLYFAQDPRIAYRFMLGERDGDGPLTLTSLILAPQQNEIITRGEFYYPTESDLYPGFPPSFTVEVQVLDEYGIPMVDSNGDPVTQTHVYRFAGFRLDNNGAPLGPNGEILDNGRFGTIVETADMSALTPLDASTGYPGGVFTNHTYTLIYAEVSEFMLHLRQVVLPGGSVPTPYIGFFDLANGDDAFGLSTDSNREPVDVAFRTVIIDFNDMDDMDYYVRNIVPQYYEFMGYVSTPGSDTGAGHWYDPGNPHPAFMDGPNPFVVEYSFADNEWWVTVYIQATDDPGQYAWGSAANDFGTITAPPAP
ncbi:MAG: hypothetical protein FWG23_03375 [Eggerthellaceae bacterium]|nr:hypothetical protein [Eggerthellaceae bacterium]